MFYFFDCHLSINEFLIRNFWRAIEENCFDYAWTWNLFLTPIPSKILIWNIGTIFKLSLYHKLTKNLILPISFSIQVQSSLKTNPGNHTELVLFSISVERNASIAATTVSCSTCVRIGLNIPPFVLKYSMTGNGTYFFTNLVKLVFRVRYQSNSIVAIWCEAVGR